MLHRDEVVCFACTEQPTFTNFSEFLSHKVRKACSQQDDDSLMASSSLCMLCPLKFSRKSSLLLHYAVFHKVHGINKFKCCESSVLSKTKFKPSRAANNGPKNLSGLQKTDRFISSVAARETEGIGKKVSRGRDLCDDFFLRLQEVEIKEASLAYTKRWLSCIYCTYRSIAIVDLIGHMQGTHPDILKQDIEKQDLVSSNNNTVIRMSVYLSKHQVVTSNKPALQTNRGHHGSSFRCDFCAKHFTNKTYLQRHREKEHIKPTFYECDLCKHVATTKHKLKAHRDKHLAKEFRCKECNFVSSVKVAIQSHRQVHRTGSHVCEICSKAYKLKDTLEKHMRVHDKSRPYGCTFDDCTFRFKTERMCRGHLKTHYGQMNNFPCSICGYSFRQKHHLKRHVENTHHMDFIGTETNHKAVERIETFSLSTPSKADVKAPAQSNRENNSSFDLQDIIIEGEGFEITTGEHASRQPKMQSIILLKTNDKNTLLYDQTNAGMAEGVYRDRESNSVYVRNSHFTEEASTSVEAPSSELLGSAMPSTYCLEEPQEQTEPPVQSTTSVEFIVDRNADEVIFSESREQNVPDTLFN